MGRFLAIAILRPLLVLAGLSGWSSGSAMEFSPLAARGGVAIRATGPIEAGDVARLQSIVPSATVDEKGLRRMLLDSPGGDVTEAMALAAVIRENRFVTLVSAECASACAMVLYPAGEYFVLLDG